MNEIKWEFAPTGGGAIDGVNNPMISHFTGNYNYHLAREIIQNSLDAKLNENDPVKVSFNVEYFSINEFPGHAQLVDIFNNCKNYWPKKVKDVHKYIDNALNCLSHDNIPFLKCSDYNTIGLSGGDNDLTGSWFNLVKSRGASSKYKGEGGSYGIGKGAPFAASNLRVLYYFTKNKTGFFIFQGIAELISFEKDDKVRRGSGSFGIDGYQSFRNPEDIPKRFWRSVNDPGLDVYIAGFKIIKNWEDELAQSVLRNFWYAIYKKELIVEIENIHITKNSLGNLLVKYFSGESLKDDIEPIGNPLKYYEAVKKGIYENRNLKSVGEVEFFFTEIEEHMNYVAMLRKPHMVVFSKAYRFPGSYCGVFICDDKKGNRVLRKMEPPSHNKWEPDSYGPDGSKILNEVHDWIRSILKSQQKGTLKGILDIPDLYKYLPFDDGMDEGDGKGSKEYTGQETDNETSKLVQKKENTEQNIKISPYRVSVVNQPEKTGLGGGLRGTGKKKKAGDGEGVGGEKGTKKALTYKEVKVIPFITQKVPSGYEYLIKIKSDADRTCRLHIFAVGDEGSEKISIIQAFDKFKVKIHSTGNKISHVHMEKDTEQKIFVHINTSLKYALKLFAYEI
jgi:hypothetical protein